MTRLLQLCATPSRLMQTLVVCLSLVLIALLLRPTALPQASRLNIQDRPWSLATPVTISSDVALSVISQRALWGPSTNPGQALNGQSLTVEKPLTAPDWRITGIYLEKAGPTVLISTIGNPVPQPLRVGDQLPGGAKILAIKSDRLTLLLHGQRLSLSTYPQ
jgi:hypothetical protein